MSEGEAENTATLDVNIFLLEAMTQQMAEDYAAKVSLLESGLLRPLTPETEVSLVDRSETFKVAQEQLAQRKAFTEQLLREFGVPVLIDEQFVQEAFNFADLWANDQKDSAERILASFDFMDRAISELKVRREIEDLENEHEEEHAVTISDGRTVKFFVSIDGHKGRIDIPLVKDFTKERIALGPNAVSEILGSPITDTDYLEIAETLLMLPGEVGEKCRLYADRATAWANSYVLERENPTLLARRREAAQELIQIFMPNEPRLSPLTDIPVHAMWTSVMRRYQEFDSWPTPQPFER